MFDVNALNKTIINALGDNELVTLTDDNINYQVKGVFTIGTADVDDSFNNNNQPVRGVYTLEVLTKDLEGVEFKRNNKVTINDVEYRIDDSPLDVHGITMITLRK
jgi:hypothetical protein